MSRFAALCYDGTNFEFVPARGSDRPPGTGRRTFALMIDDRTVAHVARLSRLELSPQELDRFRTQLAEILTYVQRLNTLDLSGVPPTAHVRPMANVLRDDQVRPSLSQEEALANAPAVEQGYFVVPPVIAEEFRK